MNRFRVVSQSVFGIMAVIGVVACAPLKPPPSSTVVNIREIATIDSVSTTQTSTPLPETPPTPAHDAGDVSPISDAGSNDIEPQAPCLGFNPVAETTAASPTAMAEANHSFILYMVAVPPEDKAMPFWRLQSVPSLALFDDPVFDTFYGLAEQSTGIGLFFDMFRPQLSPNGRYLALPRIAEEPPATGGVWLVDLQTQVLRELLTQTTPFTWNSTSDHIAYIDDLNTLCSLDIAPNAIPTPLFTHPDLDKAYASWSPDGKWIAVISTVLNDAEAAEPALSTYWLISTTGEAPRELASRPSYSLAPTMGEIQWSPDSQLLLIRNELFSPAESIRSPAYDGSAHWMPNSNGLLLVGSNGLRFVTLTGDEIAIINQTFTTTWAFSPDGQQLAYSQPGDAGAEIFVFDLNQQTNQLIGTIPTQGETVSTLYWRADDAFLAADEGLEPDPIWLIEAKPNSKAERLVDDGYLIQVVNQ